MKHRTVIEQRYTKLRTLYNDDIVIGGWREDETFTVGEHDIRAVRSEADKEVNQRYHSVEIGAWFDCLSKVELHKHDEHVTIEVKCDFDSNFGLYNDFRFLLHAYNITNKKNYTETIKPNMIGNILIGWFWIVNNDVFNEDNFVYNVYLLDKFNNKFKLGRVQHRVRLRLPSGSNIHGTIIIIEPDDNGITVSLPSGSNIHGRIKVRKAIFGNLPYGSNIHGRVRVLISEPKEITVTLPHGSNIHGRIRLQSVIIGNLPSGSNIHGRVRVQKVINSNLVSGSNIHASLYLPITTADIVLQLQNAVFQELVNNSVGNTLTIDGESTTFDGAVAAFHGELGTYEYVILHDGEVVGSGEIIVDNG